MFSKLSETLPAGKDWVYEVKLDGQRTIADVRGKKLLLYTRNLQNVTDKYPELQDLHGCLKNKSAILDGEIVALRDGVPSFELLQQRMNLRDLRALKKAVEEVPVLYYVFDLLELDGKSFLTIPLNKRRQTLARILRPFGCVKLLPSFPNRNLVEKAQQFGYEGVVAKRMNSIYSPGMRTDAWIKFKFQLTDSFVIGGWMEGGRSMKFGSLLVGKYSGKKLICCGRVGTGFTESTIRNLLASFQKIPAKGCPFADTPEAPESVHWLRPKLVAEIKFKEWTGVRNLRAPVFLGIRADIAPHSCRSSAISASRR